MGRLILNSRGLNTKIGCYQILEKIKDENLSDKKMFLVSFPPYGVDELIVRNCVEILGFQRENLYLSADGIPKDIIPDFVFVTEGNTFEVLDYMRKQFLITYIQDLVKEKGTTYIGSSAGAMIAGSDIMLARDFDSNFVRMIDFTAVQLFDGTILPHSEQENFKRSMENIEPHILNRYGKILFVSNEEVIVMEGDLCDNECHNEGK